MARFYPAGGAGGKVGSDELTATSNKVLEGYSYVGNDTDEDIGTGSIPIRHAHTHDPSVAGQLGIVESQLYVRFPTAYYEIQNGVNPYVYVPFASLAEVLGIDAAKMLTTETISGVQGTIGTKAAATYYATTSDQTIAAGQYLGGVQTIKKLTQTNLTAANILKGKTITINNGDANVWSVAGSLDVQSILSFSAAPYSSTQITFTWKNPAKGPFSGVIIVGKVGSYPTSISDGTRWYKGSGNNAAASGTSSTTINGFTSGTAYYFRAFAYAIKDGSEWICETSYTATATTTKGMQTFTSSGVFTVPAGVRSIDIFCVGGGGAGGAADDEFEHDESDGDTQVTGYYSGAGGGGGGGYTATKKGYAVTPGQTFAVTIGAGAPQHNIYTENGVSRLNYYNGYDTSFGNVLSAAGGKTGDTGTFGAGGGDGGSAGGSIRWSWSSGGVTHRYDGGSDGSSITTSTYYNELAANGQGTTTRAFGESNGTLYAGGGGARCYAGTSNPGAGGGGGTANTGGGGNGRLRYYNSGYTFTGTGGGSGICIVRWGY